MTSCQKMISEMISENDIRNERSTTDLPFENNAKSDYFFAKPPKTFNNVKDFFRVISLKKKKDVNTAFMNG